MNKVLVTGSNGQLGSEIRALHRNYTDYKFLFADFHDLDITNHKAVNKLIINNKINVIINCAAYTAVDKAETEPELADAINHLAVANLATISKKNNIKFFHISTDYVFDGKNNRPYVEADMPNPLSQYGKSKLLGELAIQNIKSPNSIIIRTSWVYSKYGDNFIKKIINLAKEREFLSLVDDQKGSPTHARDLANTILKLIPHINGNNSKLFHYCNSGYCSWYDFAVEILRLKKINIDLKKVNSEDYNSIALRPKFSPLDCSLISNLFPFIPQYDWKLSLKKFIDGF